MRYTKSLVVLLLVLRSIITCCYAQTPEIHDPRQIYKIMEESKLTYELTADSSMRELPCADHSDKLNFVDQYQKKNGKKLEMGRYNMSASLEETMRKAERYFADKQYDSAMQWYLKAHTVDPKFSPALDYIGQMYEKRGDHQQAMNYYKKAIVANYYDHMAHWFLADLYANSLGDLKEAKNEITIAHILNRNNPRIQGSMDDIYARSHTVYRKWCFEPDYSISKDDTGNIQVRCTPNWFTYALVKAVWKYEPGYRQSMGGDLGTYVSVEDKEALACLSFILMKDSAELWKTVPALSGLMQAVKKKMFNEYLMYEVALRKYPSGVYMLDEEFLNDMRKYVMDIHTAEL